MANENNTISALRKRIDDINQLIYNVAVGNFDYKLERSDAEDELDGLIGGINMLGEELKASTVSRDYMESIYRGVVDLLFVLKPDFTIEQINHATENDLGYSSRDILNQSFSKMVIAEDIHILEEIKERLKTESTCHNIEINLRRKDEKSIPTSASFSILYDNQKKNLGFLVIAKDITALKKSEQELLIAKNNAELANLAKTSFLTNMSHEIRTPLNGILGFIDLLLETQTDDTQKYYLKLIKGSGDSLSKLLNDILDLTKVEQGKLTLETIHFRIDSLMDTIRPFKFLAEEKGLGFSVHFEKSLPTFVAGDPSRLNQIIRNLLANALKFTESGEIFISFHPEYKTEKDFVLVGKVIDSGLGIPSAKQKIIFDSFIQADDSTTRKYGGTGLGLTITSHLTELMKGNIVVESPPLSENQEKGTAFTFRVKMKVGNAESATNQDLPVEKMKFSKAYQILVVDDNDINLTLAKKVLENMGGSVKVARNGVEAIECVEENTFDFILMDIQMPVMDGYEATRNLRAKKYTSPIIALSANAFSEQIEKCLAVGMNSHIRKPFTKKDIYIHIESLLANKDNDRD